MLRFLAYVWASPWTLFGLLWGLVGLATGGRVQVVEGAVEFHGGLPAWMLRRLPMIGGAAAITFGHTILAQTSEDLAASRAHEQVHVRQYERWGPFFVPAYLLCSLGLLLRRRSPYWDNPFEKEAYGQGHDL